MPLGEDPGYRGNNLVLLCRVLNYIVFVFCFLPYLLASLRLTQAPNVAKPWATMWRQGVFVLVAPPPRKKARAHADLTGGGL